MLTTNNINISSLRVLPSPGEIRSELPVSLDAVAKVIKERRELCDIFDGKSQRKVIIVGPCSIHHQAGALEYAAKLKKLSDEVSDKLMIIMRVYFEKPRTTVGWKGLIYDPDLNGAYNIEKGIFRARKLLLRIVDLGLPTGTEMLDPIIAQYIADAVVWSAIGARTTEAQTHRQLASGLSMPVGFKNATDGSFQSAIDAIDTAMQPHSFIGVLEDGQVGIFRTKGNKYSHIVLRGGSGKPNYQPEYIAFLKVMMQKHNMMPNIIVDCSHSNSGKKCTLQGKTFREILEQIRNGEEAIKGMMLESYLKCGNQPLLPGSEPQYDVSVTDECIGWEETEELIRYAHSVL